MSDTRLAYGSRIKFMKQGNLLVSHKIFSNGLQMCRLIIDTTTLVYNIIDPVTGSVLVASTKKYTNFEVCQRNAKKALKDFLGILFVKEVKAKKTVEPSV
jgi:hypothetical protein